MANLVTCDAIGKALAVWLRNASQKDIDELCESLDCGIYTSEGGFIGDGSNKRPLQLDLSGWFENASPEEIEELCDLLNCPLDIGEGGGLSGSGTKDDPLIVSLVPGKGLTGKGTADDPLDVKLSLDEGNVLQIRNDGLYYGDTAPPDTAHLYVDAKKGDDDNPGTEEAPFKTIRPALEANGPDIRYTIYLYEDQVHEYRSSWGGLNRKAFTMTMYGPSYNAVRADPGFAGASQGGWGAFVAQLKRPTLKVIADRVNISGGKPTNSLGYSAPSPKGITFVSIKIDTSDTSFYGGAVQYNDNAALFGGVDTHPCGPVVFRGCQLIIGSQQTMLRSGDPASTVNLIGCEVLTTKGNKLIAARKGVFVGLGVEGRAAGTLQSGGLTNAKSSSASTIGKCVIGATNPIVSNFSSNINLGVKTMVLEDDEDGNPNL